MTQTSTGRKQGARFWQSIHGISQFSWNMAHWAIEQNYAKISTVGSHCFPTTSYQSTAILYIFLYTCICTSGVCNVGQLVNPHVSSLHWLTRQGDLLMTIFLERIVNHFSHVSSPQAVGALLSVPLSCVKHCYGSASKGSKGYVECFFIYTSKRETHMLLNRKCGWRKEEIMFRVQQKTSMEATSVCCLHQRCERKCIMKSAICPWLKLYLL